jgi:hypothetical protein
MAASARAHVDATDLDDHKLVLRVWKQAPTRDRTIAACAALLEWPIAAPTRLVHMLVGHVLRTHLDDVALLVLAARLQLDTGDLRGAHRSLALAESIAPTSSAPPRWLGEVLLRMGDARRASVAFALARSHQDGGADDHPIDAPPIDLGVEDLLERARGLVELQITDGELAVAEEMARAPLRARRSGAHRIER